MQNTHGTHGSCCGSPNKRVSPARVISMTSVDAAALFPLLSAVLQADKNARETAERA